VGTLKDVGQNIPLCVCKGCVLVYSTGYIVSCLYTVVTGF